AVLRWAVEEAEGSVAIRLAIGPSPRRIELGAGWTLAPWRGTTLLDGGDGGVLVLAYGPVLLHEALAAAEACRADGVRATVVDLPWLHRVDGDWLRAHAARHAA